MWCVQSATRLTAESKRTGPDPANGIFGEKNLFSFFFSSSCLCLGACKWKEKHCLLKVSTGSDLHCIIQIAVKCIICSNCMVQRWVNAVCFWIHACHFSRRLTQTGSHIWIMDGCCCTYAKWFSVLLHFTRDWIKKKIILISVTICACIPHSCLSVCRCAADTQGKTCVLVSDPGQVA